MRSVQVEGSGTSKIYLRGGIRSVFAHLSMISEAHVDSSTGKLWLVCTPVQADA